MKMQKMKVSLYTIHKDDLVDKGLIIAYNISINAKKGRSSLPVPVREKAVGASLSGAGGEGRPGAASLNHPYRRGRRPRRPAPAISKQAGNSRYRVKSVMLLAWNSGGTAVFHRPETSLFRGVFSCPGKGASFAGIQSKIFPVP